MEQEKATGLGKGGLSLAVAKLFFLVTGYAVSIALTRLVPPATFGLYRVVSDLVAVPNMVLIQSLLFAVSRPMSAEFGAGLPSYAGLRRRGFRMALGLGGVVTGVLLLGADLLATHLLGDPGLATPLRVVAPIPLIYAAYAVNVGTLNATRRFHHQAALDIFMAATKTSLIVGTAALGLGLAEILGGFTAASAMAFALSISFVAWTRPPSAGRGNSDLPPMAKFTGALLVFTGAVNLLVAMDLLTLQRFAVGAAAKDAVGFYSSANLVARVPYSVMVAVSLIMFPLIATLSAQEDRAQISRYVAGTAKVCVVLLTFMSAVAAAAAPEVQRLLFPAAYGGAAAELRFLVWGLSGYSLAVTVAWICNSNGRSSTALALVAAPLLTVAGLAQVLVPGHFTQGAAIAVAAAGAAGAMAALWVLHRAFDARLAPGFVLKIAAGVALVELAARAWMPGGKLGILAKLLALAVVFVGTVAATRAVTLAEVRGLRRAR
jgi:stage V sporulation protein B